MAFGSAVFGAACLALLLFGRPAAAEDFTAVYDAYWAGLPAAQIELGIRDLPAGYRGVMMVRSRGFAALITHFRGTAIGEGSLAADGVPTPARFTAFYDLRKRRDRRLNMQFVARDGALFAERGSDDTSRKPPLAAAFRRNVLDPMTALIAIRQQLRRGGKRDFTVPVYDGARRFDVQAEIKPSPTPNVLALTLTLRPIAGFKGDTSEDGDPDTAPRVVDLTMTNDKRFMPMSMSVPIYYVPLVVQFARLCVNAQACAG